MLTEELKSSFRNLDRRLTINITFLILDVCMQNTLYTAGSRHMNFEYIHIGPTYLGHTSCNFPKLILTDDLEPVLTSFKIIKIDENA